MIPEVLNFPFANSGKRPLSDALRDLIIEAPRGNVLCAIAAGGHLSPFSVACSE